jgi:hypothetical protein|tara:strand:- start:543 stop:1022 length:480 start_codon:yes stop_codon:yes gene_type:complete
MANRDKFTSVAEQVPFDNSTNGFASETVQDAIEEIGASASPGFSFGRSGSLSQNTWLRRPGNVPSNRAGVTVSITSPVVVGVACANRNVETYDVEIYEHEGNQANLTLLGTVTVTSATSDTFVVNFPATQGKQLAVKLGSTATGQVRDLGVDLTLIGSN